MALAKQYLSHFDENLVITGPYLNKKQGRRFVTIVNKLTGKKTQKTYAKYLMEVHLGRELSKEEMVDHIDRDKLNDALDNLQIFSPSEHTARNNKRAESITLPCAWCGVNVTKSARNLRTANTSGKAGPFCSASCRGKYGASVSNGGEKLSKQPHVESKYFFIDE